MKIIKPSFEIINELSKIEILRQLEKIGRVCYKSEEKIDDDSYEDFLKGIIKRKHFAILEHISISCKIICDRGVSHEIVRHRIAAYAQESTRFCNYSNDKFGNEITVIEPCFYDKQSEKYSHWVGSCLVSEMNYFQLLESGSTPQEARSVLPNSLKTEIVCTYNLREWRHFFELRALGITGKPHPQMLEITIPMLEAFKKEVPIIFDDLKVE